MAQNSENLRIFLGLPIERQDGDHFKEIILDSKSSPTEDLRWEDPVKYHLTIRFIGEFPRDNIPSLIAAIEKLRLPKFTLTVLHMNEFPGQGGPFLVANVRLSNELAQIFHLISNVLKNFGIKMEHHSFRPHITLAKIKKNSKPHVFDKIQLKNYEIRVDRLILYQSHVTDSGSQYVFLHTFPLFFQKPE